MSFKMKLTETQSIYTVTNESSIVKLSGNVTVYETKNGNKNVSGTFTKIEDESYAGDFYYSKSEDNKVNKSYNSVPEDLATEVENLLNSTINEIDSQLTTLIK